MPERLQEWLHGKQLPEFSHFTFIDSGSFEPINKNYWKVVHEPVGRNEIALFCAKKLDSCLNVMVILANHANLEQYLTQFLSMDVQTSVVNNYRQVLYMFKERLSRVNGQLMIDEEAGTKFASNLQE